MGGFLLRKVGAALIVLVLASMLVFVGVRAIPGDPALALGGENRDPAVLSAIRHKYGLDQPMPVQYVHWVSLAVRGDLGTDQRELSVAHTIVTRLPITLELAGPRDTHRVGDRDRRRGDRSRAARKAERLRGDDGRARRAVGPALLARHPDDRLLRGAAALAARRRLRRLLEQPGAEPRAHADAGDRARHRARRRC